MYSDLIRAESLRRGQQKGSEARGKNPRVGGKPVRLNTCGGCYATMWRPHRDEEAQIDRKVVGDRRCICPFEENKRSIQFFPGAGEYPILRQLWRFNRRINTEAQPFFSGAFTLGVRGGLETLHWASGKSKKLQICIVMCIRAFHGFVTGIPSNTGIPSKVVLGIQEPNEIRLFDEIST